jgi:hypothetical protein
MKLALAFLISLMVSSQALALFSVEDETYDQKIHRLETQERLNLLQIFTEVPSTFYHAATISATRAERSKWVYTGVATIGTLYYDQDLYLQAQKWGRMWGLSNEDELKPYGNINDFTLMWGPSDVSSTLYFLGDGWVHIGGAVGLLGYGYFADRTRPYNTAIEMLNGFLCSTIFEQALKRAFGREDPGVQTYPGGAWRPFPGNSDYDKEKTRHDAFPSGHVMTTTVSFTVIRGNFPEYDHILFPLQVVYTGALAFGMTNNGIHWVGDYPLGIALGYFFGRSALKMAKSSSQQEQANSDEIGESKYAWLTPMLLPGIDRYTGEPTTNLRWEF